MRKIDKFKFIIAHTQGVVIFQHQNPPNQSYTESITIMIAMQGNSWIIIAFPHKKFFKIYQICQIQYFKVSLVSLGESALQIEWDDDIKIWIPTSSSNYSLIKKQTTKVI